MKRIAGKEKSNIGKRKILVDIGEHRKAWVEKVAEFSDSSLSDVFRALVDQAIVEDPESFTAKIEKWKGKAEIDEIERQAQELELRRQRLVEKLQGRAPADTPQSSTTKRAG